MKELQQQPQMMATVEEAREIDVVKDMYSRLVLHSKKGEVQKEILRNSDKIRKARRKKLRVLVRKHLIHLAKVVGHGWAGEHRETAGGEAPTINKHSTCHLPQLLVERLERSETRNLLVKGLICLRKTVHIVG
ncbi:MAG: hypothetical protein ACRDL7_07885 [Gaiellaceae bacterium]